MMRVVSTRRTTTGVNVRDVLSRRVLRLAAWVVLAVTTLFILAHGCHKSDEDHEPLFLPDTTDRAVGLFR